jgi:hypothetical protein
MEENMTGEQVLESVTYLSWALDFLLLGIALAVGTISYRRFAGRKAGPPHPQDS